MGDVFQMLVMQRHQILSIKDSDINIYKSLPTKLKVSLISVSVSIVITLVLAVD